MEFGRGVIHTVTARCTDIEVRVFLNRDIRVKYCSDPRYGLISGVFRSNTYEGFGIVLKAPNQVLGDEYIGA